MRKLSLSTKWLVSLPASAVLVALCVSLGLLIVNRNVENRNVADVINLPDEKDVVNIRAIAHGENFMEMKSTPEFTVPPEYFSVVLGVLKPAKKSDIDDSFINPPLGDLQITTSSGRVIKVRFGWAGQNPLRFSVDGVHCVRSGPYCLRGEFGIDESVRLLGLLEESYREQIEQTKSKLMPFFIEEIEWSTGRRQSQTN